jgi:hypothetical protein
MLLTVEVGIQTETDAATTLQITEYRPSLRTKRKKNRIAVSLLKPDAHYDVSRLEVEPLSPDAMFYFCCAAT